MDFFVCFCLFFIFFCRIIFGQNSARFVTLFVIFSLSLLPFYSLKELWVKTCMGNHSFFTVFSKKCEWSVKVKER